MIETALTPRGFNDEVVKMLIKDESKSSSDVANVRPITLSTVLASLFERMILAIVEQTIYDPIEQMGFKSGCSTTRPINILDKMVNVCKRRRESVHLCALDASKAFDKVLRPIMLAELSDEVPGDIILSLKGYYEASRIRVEQGDERSEFISTTVGLKQGGPLSPKLFACYIRPLIRELRLTGHGVRVDDSIINTIAYAGDILLVAPTAKQMNRMLAICEMFGIKKGIRWNPDKTTWM